MESALVFSLGPATTAAYLFDLVGDRFRFVARGQVPALASAEATLIEDALGAVARLERITGRVLFTQQEPVVPETPDGYGCDAVLAVCSPGGTLRVAVVGGDSSLAYDCGPRAVEGAGLQVACIAALDHKDVKSAGGMYEAVRQLRHTSPDVILVAVRQSERDDAQLAQLGEALASFEAAPGASSPTVLLAGDETSQPILRRSLSAKLNLRGVPALQTKTGEENLEQAKLMLSTLHAERWCAQLPDYNRFSTWLVTSPISRDVALSNVFRFLGAVTGGTVCGVDLDRNDVGMAVASPDVFSTFRVRPTSLPTGKALDWLPWEAGGEAFERSALNLKLRPAALATELDEALFEGALLRAYCREVREDVRQAISEPPMLPRLGQTIGTGSGTACAATPEEAALLLLDAVQPVGVGYLRWDSQSVLAPVGALAMVEPAMAAQLAMSEAVATLGVYLAPTGGVRPGAVAVELDATYDSGSQMRMEVLAGTLETLPIPRNRSLAVTVSPVSRLDLGPGLGKRLTLEVDHLPLGMIVDARGRPIVRPNGDWERRAGARAARRALGCPAVAEVPV